jgi:hypothetical protein
MEQARSMDQVVDEPAVRILADTPDKAVVWAVALGLRDELAAVLTRTLEDRRAGVSSAQSAFYPLWLGSTSTGSGFGDVAMAGGMQPGTVADASGGLFSGSPVPDFNGMFSALGSIGATPASSSSGSSGGGFGGGGSSGGGGASGSF